MLNTSVDIFTLGSEYGLDALQGPTLALTRSRGGGPVLVDSSHRYVDDVTSENVFTKPFSKATVTGECSVWFLNNAPKTRTYLRWTHRWGR